MEPLDVTPNRPSRVRFHKQNTVKLLGNEVYLDENVRARMQWCQRAIGVCALVTFVLFIIGDVTGTHATQLLAIAFALLSIAFVGIMYYKNISMIILKRLFKEPNVVIILTCCTILLLINAFKPYDSFSIFNAIIYMFLVSLVILLDAVKVKSRLFVIGIFILFLLLNVWCIYDTTLGSSSNRVKLLTYTVQNIELTIWKRPSMRTIYIQVLLFSLTGTWTMIKDKEMALMMFATGNIYRDQEHQGEDNAINNRSSMLEILGHDAVNIDDKQLHARVKWGQRGVFVFSFIGLSLYIISSIFKYTELNVVVIISAVFATVSVGLMYYKNISFKIVKQLLIEPNVILILMLGVFDLIINIVKPYDSLSTVHGVTYMVIVFVVVFVDAVKAKSRLFVICLFTIFIVLNIYNVYDFTFGRTENGVYLVSYTVNNEHLVIRKRSVKRSIFIQILLFSTNGIWTLIKDKNMEFMIFATGHIYRNTGTASKYVLSGSTKRRSQDEKRNQKWKVTAPPQG